METVLLPVKIDAITYILAKDSFGGLSTEEPKSWHGEFLKEFSIEEIDRLPFRPTGAVDLKDRPSTESSYIVKLNDDDLRIAMKEFIDPYRYNAMLTKSKQVKSSEPRYTDSFMLLANLGVNNLQG
jgi:hypothetical protein